MIFHLIIGAVVMLCFLLLVNHTQRSEKKVQWWQWLLTIIGFLYAIFALEVIYGFINEGAGRAALVMGLILGIVAVIWGVLMGRFVSIHLLLASLYSPKLLRDGVEKRNGKTCQQK